MNWSQASAMIDSHYHSLCQYTHSLSLSLTHTHTHTHTRTPELLEEGRLEISQQQHTLPARAGARRAAETVNVRLAVGEAHLDDEGDAGVVDACACGVSQDRVDW